MKPSTEVRAGRRHRLTRTLALLASSALVGWIGCTSLAGDEPLGVAQIAVTNVPADGSVGCIQITATGDVSTTKLLDVSPGQSSVFPLHGLPTGSVAFVGDAFPSICAVVSAGTAPTWVSDPVIATVTTTSPVTVTLSMHRDGLGNVGVDFPDAGCRANGVPCQAGGECCAGQCGSGACCTPLGDTCASNIDCCTGLCNAGVCTPLPGCGANGAACQVGAECCGSSCVAGLCQQPQSCQQNGTSCAAASDCCGTQCVDGMCCDTACGGGATGDCQACSTTAGAAMNGVCGPTTGNACNDGSACSQTDTCQSGVCSGSNPIVCFALDQCHLPGGCDPTSGACSTMTKPDGAACDDGNVGTQLDACQGGACLGCKIDGASCGVGAECCGASCLGGICQPPPMCQQNGTSCAAASDCCGNQCVDGMCCDTACGGGATGDCQACSTTAGAAMNGVCGPTTGNSCDDGSACSQSDTCQSGVCTGSNPIVCVALDQCHVPGACDPTSGACSVVAKPNGAACNDGDACTQTDTCQAGVCAGASPVSCGAPGQCQTAGVCNPATGVCSFTNKINGSSCNDGDGCTQTDTCQSGACSGGNPVVCIALDQCHAAGSCNPAAGTCSNPAKIDGASCDDGDACTQSDTCQAGSCAGANPVSCGAPGQCQNAGVCNAATGVCGFSNKANGSSCNDGDGCTQTDTCQAGACSGGNPVVCAALDQCHTAGSCNPAAGTCSNPLKANGIACNDGNAATVSDACHSGICLGNTCVNVVRGAGGFTVADTHLRVPHPVQNYGTLPAIQIGTASQSLVRFDLAFISTAATVATATLTVHTLTTDSFVVNIHNVLAPWSESVVTYTSFGGAFAPAVLASYTPTLGFHAMSVPALAQTWIAAPASNYGVLLDSGGSTGTSIDASESTTASFRPTLQVCYY